MVYVFPGGVRVYKDVMLAEKRGYTHAWLYDSQMLFSDVYASLALCAVKYEKIKLGPGDQSGLTYCAGHRVFHSLD